MNIKFFFLHTTSTLCLYHAHMWVHQSKNKFIPLCMHQTHFTTILIYIYILVIPNGNIVRLKHNMYLQCVNLCLTVTPATVSHGFYGCGRLNINTSSTINHWTKKKVKKILNLKFKF